MSVPVLLALGVLGGAGAVARFVVDGAVSRRAASAFPFGTMAVNLTGTLLLGILVGAALQADPYRLLGTGLLGAYTTFSTWAFESHRLAANGRPRLAALNIAGSLVLGVAAAWIGRALGEAL